MDFTIEELSDNRSKKLINSLRVIIKLPNDKLDALSSNLIKLDGSRLLSRGSIDKISKNVGLDSLIIGDAIAILASIYANSMSSKTDFDEAFDKITDDTFNESEKKKIIKLVSNITPVLRSFWENLETKFFSTLPIDEIAGMRSRIINVAQFETDFSLNDDIDSYKANIKHFQAKAH